MSEILSNIPLAATFSRKHFLARLKRWKSGVAERQQFILRHELATDSERLAAERWLRANGWSQEAVDAAKRR
jgi:hypothetical protein